VHKLIYTSSANIGHTSTKD